MNDLGRVLWIEDGAKYELALFAGHVLVHSDYDLVAAEDASAGVDVLLEEPCAAVIIDIRLSPGDDRSWQELYLSSGGEVKGAKLGYQLLLWLLGDPKAKVNLGERRPPAWITPERIGVLTVERELGDDLAALGITVYVMKQADMRETILLETIKAVLTKADGSGT